MTHTLLQISILELHSNYASLLCLLSKHFPPPHVLCKSTLTQASPKPARNQPRLQDRVIHRRLLPELLLQPRHRLLRRQQQGRPAGLPHRQARG